MNPNSLQVRWLDKFEKGQQKRMQLFDGNFVDLISVKPGMAKSEKDFGFTTVKCNLCSGTGEVPRMVNNVQVKVTCAKCLGKGYDPREWEKFICYAKNMPDQWQIRGLSEKEIESVLEESNLLKAKIAESKKKIGVPGVLLK